MRLIYKICLWNVAIVFLLAALLAMSAGYNALLSDYFGFLGLVSLGGAAIDLIVSLLLFAAGKKEWAQGYLLTAGVLLLIGLGTCGSMWIR